MHIIPFVNTAKQLFLFYKSLGEKTFDQISDEDLFCLEDEACNNIPILVKHLHGNMLSRWTDFLNSDGEKSWRQRDHEFDDDIDTREELLSKWEEGWKCLFDALDSIDSSNYSQLVFIRNEGHTIEEAITRQLCHYSYHVGQIVFIGKHILKNDWHSLSIPKNQSHVYNEGKFKEPKRKIHFTHEFIDSEE